MKPRIPAPEPGDTERDYQRPGPWRWAATGFGYAIAGIGVGALFLVAALLKLFGSLLLGYLLGRATAGNG